MGKVPTGYLAVSRGSASRPGACRNSHSAWAARLGPPGAPPLYAAALTGLAPLQDRDAAIAAGFDDHLAKPVDVDLLVEKLLIAKPR